jgi:hypothetical protein
MTLTAQLVEDLASQRHAVESLRAEVADMSQTLAQQSQILTEHRKRLLLALRMVRDDDARQRQALLDLRGSPSYEDAFDADDPLVSVLVPTFNNWELLRDRSLPSVLAQTYQNWECIVVGDSAPDETREVVEAFGDKRLRFVNLPYRGPYPDDPADLHRISGTPPWNAGLALAQGKWIAGNADDDALRPGCIDTLLTHAKRHRAEVAYGYIDEWFPDKPLRRLGAFPPRWGQWGIQASLFHAGLRFLPLLPSDWVFEIPNDMSLLERMLRIGVRFAMAEETVVDYYPSTLWRPSGEMTQDHIS